MSIRTTASRGLGDKFRSDHTVARGRFFLDDDCPNRIAGADFGKDGQAVAARHSAIKTLQIGTDRNGPHGLLDADELKRIMSALHEAAGMTLAKAIVTYQAFLLPICPRMVYPASAFRLDRFGKKPKPDASC